MSASVFNQSNTEGTYTFSSQPRAVQQRKPKYRPAAPEQEDEQIFYGNIMYDRRVIRGSTYAQHLLPTSATVDPIEVQRQQEARRREIARKRAKQQQIRTRSPPPVDGRRHMDIQTELYLEELSDKVEETEASCQTDAFLDRPPSPMFIPAKTGVDKDTQILEGELFDFDVEVQPVLEVLVGKTVEQALLEVMEEEELANLREQQRVFEELRNAELAEFQRLEEQERRHREEKERRMKEQEEMLKKEKETADKIAARAFAQSYMADLIPSVFGNLTNNGYFYDAVERGVEKHFMPWLTDRVTERLDQHVASRSIFDQLLRQVVNARREQFERLQEIEKQEQSASLLSPPGVTGASPRSPVVGDVEEGEEGEAEEGDVDKQEVDDDDTKAPNDELPTTTDDPGNDVTDQNQDDDD